MFSHDNNSYVSRLCKLSEYIVVSKIILCIHKNFQLESFNISWFGERSVQYLLRKLLSRHWTCSGFLKVSKQMDTYITSYILQYTVLYGYRRSNKLRKITGFHSGKIDVLISSTCLKNSILIQKWTNYSAGTILAPSIHNNCILLTSDLWKSGTPIGPPRLDSANWYILANRFNFEWHGVEGMTSNLKYLFEVIYCPNSCRPSCSRINSTLIIVWIKNVDLFEEFNLQKCYFSIII